VNSSENFTLRVESCILITIRKNDKVIADISAIESDLYADAEKAMKGYDIDKNVERLNDVAQYYLKKKYLLRIKDNLDKFVFSCLRLLSSTHRGETGKLKQDFFKVSFILYSAYQSHYRLGV